MDNRNYQLRFEEELNKEEVNLSGRENIKVHINEFTAALIKNNVIRKLFLKMCDLDTQEMRVEDYTLSSHLKIKQGIMKTNQA